MIINANNNGRRTPSKKSGEIPNMLASKNSNKTEKLETNTVSKTFIKFSLGIFINSITIEAPIKSINTNSRSSPIIQSLIKKMNTASRITLTISQNIQLFSQDLNFSMLINYKIKYIHS